MLLYCFPDLENLYLITFIIKGNANNGRIPPSCPFLALMTPFSDIAFINRKATVCIIEENTVPSIKQP